MKHYRQLTYEERIQIKIFLQQRKTVKEIAYLLGRSRTTISRELHRNSPYMIYVPDTAHITAIRRKQEAASVERIGTYVQAMVIEKLKKQWSPEQIAHRLKKECNIDISHEWVYQLVYQDKKDGGFLYLHLRWGHRKRKKRFGGRDKRCLISNRVSIEERPRCVNQRKRLGDFEGDTVVGRNHKSNLLTLVDRKSRFAIIKKLEDKSATHVARAITAAIREVKGPYFTTTYDNGLEFAGHQSVCNRTGTKSYFAHPYSSYERGTNENTNGLIRQYFPKKTDLSLLTHAQVQGVQHLINHRPRKCLGYRSAYECYYQQDLFYFSSG